MHLVCFSLLAQRHCVLDQCTCVYACLSDCVSESVSHCVTVTHATHTGQTALFHSHAPVCLDTHRLLACVWWLIPHLLLDYVVSANESIRMLVCVCVCMGVSIHASLPSHIFFFCSVVLISLSSQHTAGTHCELVCLPGCLSV